MSFSKRTRTDHLDDVDFTGRADGRTWVWDETAQAHVYVPLPEGDGGSSGPQLAVADAIYTWWNDPNRAVTFRNHIYTGGVENSGDIVVESTSPEDDRMVLGSFEDDDHNNPALLVEPDHGPLVFYARHRMDTLLRYRRGTDPGDLTTLGAEQTLTTSDVCTYAQLWRRPGSDTVWVLTRVKTFSDPVTWEFFRSDNYTDTWGPAQSLLGPEQYVYIGSTQVGSTVRCAVAKHPDADSPDVWYFEIDLDDGAITNRDGTVIGNLDGTNLPLTTADLETVYTAPSGHGMRLLACSDRADPDGGPALAVATWTTDSDTVYRHVDYDGGAWTASQVCPAGEVFGFQPSKHYHGGVAFPDRTLGGELLVSREEAGTWHVERWVQQGTSWIFAESYQASDTHLLFRPWPSRGGGFVFCRAETYSPTGTRGTGLSILAVEGDHTVTLGGSGTSNRAAREDHDHGQRSGFAFDGGDATGQETAFFDGGSA